MRKLLVLINNFQEGGAQHMIYELLNNIDLSRYEMKVICYEGKYGTSLEDKVEMIMPVTYLGYSGHINLNKTIIVLKEIDKYSPDIVHANQGSVFFGAIWSIIRKKPIVITVHTIPEKAFNKKNEYIIKIREKLSHFKMVAVSEDNYALIKSYYCFKEPSICFINNGISCNRYYKKPHEIKRFINVARQDDNKNQSLIIRCFDELSKRYKCQLILVGDGPNHDKLVEMTKERNLEKQVVFTGNISDPESYYAIADVYLQASHREAMPLSVLEAMAAGLPIVATNVGGLKDVVKDNGYLVPDNDEDSFLAAMEKMLTLGQPELDAMSMASERIVKSQYSAQQMAVEYMNIYDELCEE